MATRMMSKKMKMDKEDKMDKKKGTYSAKEEKAEMKKAKSKKPFPFAKKGAMKAKKK